MKSVTTHEAKTHLSRLLAEVEGGEEIVIYRGSRPAARLVPVARGTGRRRPRVGHATSAPVRLAEGALEPMTDEQLREWGL